MNTNTNTNEYEYEYESEYFLEMRKLWSRAANSKTKEHERNKSKISNKEIYLSSLSLSLSLTLQNYHNLYLYISNVGIEQVPIVLPSSLLLPLLPSSFVSRVTERAKKSNRQTHLRPESPSPKTTQGNSPSVYCPLPPSLCLSPSRFI